MPTYAVARELGSALDVDVARFTVVGEGVSEAVRDLPLDAARRATRLRVGDGDFVLTLATLEPRKGLDILLQALARPEAPDLPLLVVGQPGWGGVDPVLLAGEAGLRPDRLRVLGRLDDGDLSVLLHRARVVAVPSRAEGFGLPLLEAMAVGTPVVATDAPALVEVAAGAAKIVPRDDPQALAVALAEVCANVSLRRSLAAAGSLRAARFTWEATAQDLWRLVQASVDSAAGDDPPDR